MMDAALAVLGLSNVCFRLEGHFQMPALTSQLEAGDVIVGAWPLHPYAAVTSTA